MPPRGRKRSGATCRKPKISKSGTSRSNSNLPTSNSSELSSPVASTSRSSASTLNPTPSTSRNVSCSARSAPSRTKATPSTSRSIPSASRRASSGVKSAASTSRSPRSKSKLTCSTPKTSRSTLASMPSTSKSAATESYSDSDSDSMPSTSKLKRKRKLKMKPVIPPPRSVSFMHLLQGRELGLGGTRHFSDAALDLKVGDYRRVKSHRFSNNNEVLHTAYFLRPGRNALVAAWYVQIKNMFTTAVAQLHYDLSRVAPGVTGYIVSRNTIVDACQLQVNPDCFVCVTSPVNKYFGELHVAVPMQGSNEYTTYKYSHPYCRPFYCCNSNSFTEKFAVGCDREVCVYSVTGIQEIRSIRDNISSLAYNDKGTVLHMGSETGDFLMYDLRTCTSTARVKVDQQLLDDVLMLSNENYCIVSGVSGCLSKIDLRMQSVVVNYPHHDRRSRRIPVSVNEGYGLLSSSGADDATRIWCLNSGKLLHSFKPPSTYPARSCLVPSSMRGNIHLVQDNYIHIYCMLR